MYSDHVTNHPTTLTVAVATSITTRTQLVITYYLPTTVEDDSVHMVVVARRSVIIIDTGNTIDHGDVQRALIVIKTMLLILGIPQLVIFSQQQLAMISFPRHRLIQVMHAEIATKDSRHLTMKQTAQLAVEEVAKRHFAIAVIEQLYDPRYLS